MDALFLEVDLPSAFAGRVKLGSTRAVRVSATYLAFFSGYWTFMCHMVQYAII